MAKPASIPALDLPDDTVIKGRGTVDLPQRGGSFTLVVSPTIDYSGALPIPGGWTLDVVTLGDGASGKFVCKTIDAINSFGGRERGSPTASWTGLCTTGSPTHVRAYRYWLMIVNNRTTNDPKHAADVVAFAIHDGHGARVAYGAGAVTSGDFTVDARET